VEPNQPEEFQYTLLWCFYTQKAERGDVEEVGVAGSRTSGRRRSRPWWWIQIDCKRSDIHFDGVPTPRRPSVDALRRSGVDNVRSQSESFWRFPIGSTSCNGYIAPVSMPIMQRTEEFSGTRQLDILSRPGGSHKSEEIRFTIFRTYL
jgi:hypothetical protein